MYYKILPSTETFKRCFEVFDKMKAANKAAFKFVQSLNLNTVNHVSIIRPSHTLAGGITGIALDYDTTPIGWRKTMRASGMTFYFPKKSNKKLIEKFEALPVVEWEEFLSIVSPRGIKDIFGTPGINYCKSIILLKSGSINKIPVLLEGNPEVQEITFTEYKKLSEKYFEKQTKKEVHG